MHDLHCISRCNRSQFFFLNFLHFQYARHIISDEIRKTIVKKHISLSRPWVAGGEHNSHLHSYFIKKFVAIKQTVLIDKIWNLYKNKYI